MTDEEAREALDVATYRLAALEDRYTERLEELRQKSEEVEALTKALAMAKQVSAELCDRCGWAMVFPGEGCCKCRADTLEAALAEAVGRVGKLTAALQYWADDFERDIASDNFVSEDRHEAMRLTFAALSTPKSEEKPKEGGEYVCESCHKAGCLGAWSHVF